MYVYIYVGNHENNMCPPGYHHNGFVATHALYSCKCILIC